MNIEAVALPLALARAGEYGQIPFSDQSTEELGVGAEQKHTLLGANLPQRDLIDFGHGIDPSYEDLVRV